MNQTRKHVVQIGDTSGFPIGMAAIEKIRLIGIALLAADVDVTVIAKKGSFTSEDKVDFSPSGNHEGIDYVYTTGSIYRPSGFLKRNVKKIQGWINEIKLLNSYRKQGRLDAAIVHSMDFMDLVIYRILANLFGFTFLFPFVELNSALPQRKSLGDRVNDYLLEGFGLSLPDGNLPISNLLIDFLNKKVPKKPYLKIPIIAEFSKFDLPKEGSDESYFLYCGAAEYSEVIYFILDAFDQLEENDYYLYLVIGGDPENKQKVKDKIALSKNKDRVRFFTRLPYSDLIQKYLNASALLIPLRFTVQDTARFPHKIGEYLASGNPMISTNVGEVKHYFKDGETAIISESYEVDAYREKMQFVIDNPSEAKAIGLRGKTFGLETFDYPVFGKEIKSFIEEIDP